MRADGFDLRHDEGPAAEAQRDDDDDRRRPHDQSEKGEPRLQRMRPETLEGHGEDFCADHEGCPIVTGSPSRRRAGPGRMTTSASCNPWAISTSEGPMRPTVTAVRRALPST